MQDSRNKHVRKEGFVSQFPLFIHRAVRGHQVVGCIDFDRHGVTILVRDNTPWCAISVHTSRSFGILFQSQESEKMQNIECCKIKILKDEEKDEQKLGQCHFSKWSENLSSCVLEDAKNRTRFKIIQASDCLQKQNKWQKKNPKEQETQTEKGNSEVGSQIHQIRGCGGLRFGQMNQNLPLGLRRSPGCDQIRLSL